MGMGSQWENKSAQKTLLRGQSWERGRVHGGVPYMKYVRQTFRKWLRVMRDALRFGVTGPFGFFRGGRKRNFCFLAAVCFMLCALRLCSVVLYHTPAEIKLTPVPRVVIEPTLQRKDFFLLILVTTSSWRWDSLHRRNAIRSAWGRLTTGASPLSSSVVVFNIGRVYSEPADEKIADEATKYGDILVGDYKDTYANVFVKVFFAFDWVRSKLNCKFVVKADDDIYIHLPNFVKWLQNQDEPDRLYAGVVTRAQRVIRAPWHRHFASYKTYNQDYWKPFAYGFVYVVSVALLPKVNAAVKFHRPFPIDDAYFGLLVETIKVEPRDLPFCARQLNTNRKLAACDDCVYHTNICIGTPLSPEQIMYVHKRVMATAGRNDSTLETECAQIRHGDPWGHGECKASSALQMRMTLFWDHYIQLLNQYWCLTLSLLSSKSVFSQPFKKRLYEWCSENL